VRIVTNSLAATDVDAAHPGYARHRQALLAAGVELFELKPDAAARAATRRPVRMMQLAFSSNASLHGKVFLVDGRRLFAGSFNLDPRSANLNTEMGLLIDSPELTATLASDIERDLPTATYRLVLAADGTLQWLESGAGGPVVHTGEPHAGLLRRMAARVLSWLPIEGML
jgi:putative cardiolipin synthase